MTAKTTKTATRYQINTWGSHPDSNNDDWWTSVPAGDTQGDAWVFFSSFAGRADDSYLELVEIVGTRIDKTFGEVEVMERIAIRPNPNFVECSPDADCGEWATLQGMSYGCEAYNDAIGSATTEGA
jgi:hypothetical protein